MFAAARGSRSVLFRTRPDGTRIRRLTTTSLFDTAPAWSPDGSRVVFSRYKDFASPDADLFVTTATGAHVRRLTKTNKANSLAAWSPDGQKIAFVRYPWSDGAEGDLSAIYVADLARDTISRLTDHTGRNTHPSWSPDGHRIVYESTQQDLYPSDPNAGRSDIWVMNSDGSGKTNLTTIRNGFDPAWSPDGKSIAYVHYDGSRSDIWSMDPSGMNHRKITTGCEYKEDPSWAPNSQRVVYVADRDGCTPRREDSVRLNVWVARVSDGEQTNLTPELKVATAPVWSPSGGAIAFVSCVRDMCDLRVVAPKGGPARTLNGDHRGSAGAPDW